MPDRGAVLRQQLADHQTLAREIASVLPALDDVIDRLVAAFDNGGRVYTFGNGGSAADAQHFAEELVGRYKRERRPLPAQSLAVDSSALTCIANDYEYDEVFARQ